MADTGEAATSFHAESLGAPELTLVNSNPQAKERMTTSDASTLTYMAINTERVTDPRVRQAIQYAVDRKSLVLAAGGAQAASPATTLITPGIPGREEFDLYPGGETGDVDKAKELLAEAGAEDLTLTLWTMNDPKATSEGQALQQAIERTGITVDLKPLDGSVWYADGTGDDPGYDLILTYWIPDYPSAASNIEPLYHSTWVGGGAFNLSRYADPEVDAMIEAATSEVDQAAAQAMWAELDQKLMEAAVSVPLTYAMNSFLAGSEVENMFVNAYPGYQNYQTLWLSE
jgi:peptide/nickel transport system substrate-binding protein